MSDEPPPEESRHDQNEAMVGDDDIPEHDSLNLTMEELSHDEDIELAPDANESAGSATTGDGDDDVLRRMMEDLREPPKSPDPKPTTIQIQIKTEHELQLGDLPSTQNSPSYVASRWMASSSGGGGASLTSPSTAATSSSKSWRNDFVAAVQANKRKRHKAAAAAASKKKAIKVKVTPATPTPKRPGRPKSAVDESMDTSSVTSSTSRKSKRGGRRSRKAEWTPEELDIFKQPLRGGKKLG